MTINEASLFILAVLIGLMGWYVDTHSADESRYKRKRRRTGPAKKVPAYEADEGDITPETIAVIKRLVPQGRMKSVKSRLF